VAQFGLPPDAGPGGAGGACTNAFLAAMNTNPQPAWHEGMAVSQCVKTFFFACVRSIEEMDRAGCNDSCRNWFSHIFFFFSFCSFFFLLFSLFSKTGCAILLGLKSEHCLFDNDSEATE
jgi:hypothetical protein